MLGVAFTTQITLGNLISLVLVIGVIAGAYYQIRGGRNKEIEASSDFWREQVQPLKDVIDTQNEQLAKAAVALDEQRVAKHEAVALLAAEKLKTDLTGVIKQLAESHAAIVARVELAEQTGTEHFIAAMEGLETRMGKKMDAFTANQKVTTETMQGILHAVSDLNKEIKTR